MALKTDVLKNGILSLLDESETLCKQDDMTPQKVKENYATKMANLIESFVKSGQVQTGIPVSTTGSSAAQSGFTTGPGTIE